MMDLFIGGHTKASRNPSSYWLLPSPSGLSRWILLTKLLVRVKANDHHRSSHSRCNSKNTELWIAAFMLRKKSLENSYSYCPTERLTFSRQTGTFQTFLRVQNNCLVCYPFKPVLSNRIGRCAKCTCRLIDKAWTCCEADRSKAALMRSEKRTVGLSSIVMEKNNEKKKKKKHWKYNLHIHIIYTKHNIQ